jgi:hypothetical protein
LEGLRRLIALLTSAAEVGAVGTKSEVTESVGVMDRQDVLKFDSKYVAKASAMCLGSVTN